MIHIFKGKNNPRVICIQLIYGKYFNKDQIIDFPKHRYKKFIKDVVYGTIERNDIINEEIKKNLDKDISIKQFDKVFEIIIKCAIFEILFRPQTSSKIIIKEYLVASNFFIDLSQTKYLNAILDKISKKLRLYNDRV